MIMSDGVCAPRTGILYNCNIRTHDSAAVYGGAIMLTFRPSPFKNETLLFPHPCAVYWRSRGERVVRTAFGMIVTFFFSFLFFFF